jgi:MFS family permease
VAMALAADVTRPQRRPLVMALIGIGIGGSFLASMALSVPLALLLGLGGLFWLTVVFALVGMALVMTVPRRPVVVIEALPAQGSSMVPVWLLSLSVFLLHGVMTLLFVTLPPMLVTGFGLELSEHWKLYVPTMFLSVVIMLPILRKVGKSLSEQRLLPWAFVALALSVGLLPFGQQWLMLAGLVTVYFLGFNLLEAAMPALLSRITGSTFQFLGAFAGGVTGGWLLARYGSAAALAAAGLVSLAWGIALSLLSKRFFLTGAAD